MSFAFKTDHFKASLPCDFVVYAHLSVESLLSRTPSPATRRNSAHNVSVTASTSTRFSHSFLCFHVLCRSVPVPSFVSFWSAATSTHSQLHSTDSSHFPLKGRMRDQISPGVRPPSCAQELLRILH